MSELIFHGREKKGKVISSVIYALFIGLKFSNVFYKIPWLQLWVI